MNFVTTVMNPLWQAAGALVLMVLALSLCRMLKKPICGWNASALVMLFHCILNAVVGIFVESVLLYFLLSAGVFLGLLLAAFGLSRLISGMSYGEYGENAMIFVAPFLFYPVLIVATIVLRLFIS